MGHAEDVDGLFTVQIDFGVDPYTLNQARRLEINVRSPAGQGEFETLAPRQELTPRPFSLATRGINVNADGDVGIGTTDPRAKIHIGGTPGVDGLMFPDGTLQTTAGASAGSSTMSSVGIMRGTRSGGPARDCTISRYGRFDLAYENLRYYLSNTYIASPVHVSGGVGGDPGNNGNAEHGTSALPFNSVYEATFAVRAGDRVRIRAGTYNERMTIWRPMRLERWRAGGIVRIGG